MNTSDNSSVVSKMSDILEITTTTVNMALAVPINSYILWLVFTGPAGRVASDIFTLNLSVCDVVFSLVSLLLVIKKIPLLRLLIMNLLYTGRPLFQTCICVERFMAVVHPVIFLKCKPLRYRLACSALAWLCIAGTSVLNVLSYRKSLGYTATGQFIYLGQCLFFMSVMLLCSLAVLRVLKRPVPGETAGRERDNSAKERAFAVICLIMVSFVVTYIIWCVAVAIFAARGLLVSEDMMLAGHIWVFITVVIGFVQPLLYLCQKTGNLPCFKPVQGT